MLDQQTQNENIGDDERLILPRIVAMMVLWLALPIAGADAGAGLAAATSAPATTPQGGCMQDLSQRLDSARADESLAQARASLVAAARKAAAEPLIRRCYRLEEIGGEHHEAIPNHHPIKVGRFLVSSRALPHTTASRSRPSSASLVSDAPALEAPPQKRFPSR